MEQEEKKNASPPAAVPRPRWRRAARWLLGTLAGLLLVLALLAGGLWWWSGTGHSLAAVLALASRHLPVGQTLETREVSGSVRAGGHIGRLRWQSPALAVEVRDLDIGWQLAPLLHRRLQLGELHAAQVIVERRGPPSDKPAEPLTGITLPLDIDLPFRIDTLRWSGPPALAATGLAGRYRHDAGLHRLDIDGVDVADGHYRAQVRLQGAAPMALDATLDGRVQAPMPEGVSPLTALAHASVQGTLTGAAARLQVAARLQPEDGAAAAQPDALRAAVQAQLAPWAPQPVDRARVELANVDAARLWPGAPQTLLDGQIGVEPDAAAPATGPAVWQADIDLRNARPGPWDAQQLPLERVEASARFDGTHWVVPHAVLDVGGGQVEAEGRWSPAPEPWQARATVRDVRPQALHTGLDAAPVDGTVSARQQGGAIDFEADLRARAPATVAQRPKARAAASAREGLRVDRVLARGQWRERTLTLEALRVDAGAARLEGHATARLDTQSGAGKLDLLLPGGQARIDGEIGRTRGAGQVGVQVADAAALQRWVESLPGLSKVFAGASAQGSAQLDARWSGGWEAVQRLRDNAPPPPREEALRLQARLAVPRLDLRLPAAAAPAGASAAAVSVPETAGNGNGNGNGAGPRGTPAGTPTLQLRSVRAELSGTPSDAALALDGEATLGTRTLVLNTRASGGQTARDQWRVALASLHLQAKDSAAGPNPWTVDLGAPVSATVRRADGGARLQVETTAGSASVLGPVPGTVRLEWQPVQFSQVAGAAGGSGSGSYRLRSQGRLLGLPMAWAQALGAQRGDTPGGIGISGDLVFDGDWDIDAVDTLRAQARLARRSGDIRVQAGEAALVTRIRSTGTGTPAETVMDAGGTGPTTPAGLRQAELVLTAQGDAVRAQLAWDSERAGQVRADATTRVARQGDGWSWLGSAALAGRLHARLPDIGVWSMLAPPGWRVGGTLEADATLSGTRALPQWQGQLGADGLSVKALVEGIDLRDGRLRAALRGDRLDITEFTLRGGAASSARIGGQSGNLSTARSEGASGGGTLSARGSVMWSAASGGDSGIRMAVDAEARSLRLLVRSDRQASVSGQLRLGLAQGLFSVRGALKIDRAVIILPDETAPSLGSDVIVRSAARDREAARQARLDRDRADQAERAVSATAQTRKPPDIDVGVDLGDDFAAQGRGVTTRLAGQVELRSSAATGGALRLTGEIRTVKGRYSAYGQELDIETGIARFSGPYDNPALDILALRPNITQRAGVQITGSALSPRVKLYSEPALSDAETLSWIVLGRASASGGAEALLMQQAALALLGGLGQKGSGSLASRFGLDEVGFKGPGAGDDVRGSAITLGKRLSRDFYVTYERSLSGTLGTLYIFYDLTRHLTLRAQAGSRSAIDLIYKISYD